MEHVPTHFGGYKYEGGQFSNMRLRPGEVQAVYLPSDKQNVSKNFIEYKVLVQHRDNGTTVARVYDHVIASDLFGGIADYCNMTYRGVDSANKLDGKKEAVSGVGSKVLVLCVNGESHNACIVGGLRDANGPKDTVEDGHRLHFRFNGIAIEINKDGELSIEYQGAMKADGTSAEGVDQKTLGTSVKITKDGNLTIADKDSKNTITVDHVNSKIAIVSDTEVDITAPKICVGSVDSDEPLVLGNKLSTWAKKVMKAIQVISVPTGMGPSGPPINSPTFEQLGQEFEENLSKKSFTEE